jgi:hypothetical protein
VEDAATGRSAWLPFSIDNDITPEIDLSAEL